MQHSLENILREYRSYLTSDFIDLCECYRKELDVLTFHYEETKNHTNLHRSLFALDMSYRAKLFHMFAANKSKTLSLIRETNTMTFNEQLREEITAIEDLYTDELSCPELTDEELIDELEKD